MSQMTRGEAMFDVIYDFINSTAGELVTVTLVYFTGMIAGAVVYAMFIHSKKSGEK
jgi:hypothetical protein